MGDVVIFDGETRKDLPPNVILNAALNASLKNAVVIGEQEDGSIYFAMSISDSPTINWLLDLAKATVINEAIGGE